MSEGTVLGELFGGNFQVDNWISPGPVNSLSAPMMTKGWPGQVITHVHVVEARSEAAIEFSFFQTFQTSLSRPKTKLKNTCLYTDVPWPSKWPLQLSLDRLALFEVRDDNHIINEWWLVATWWNSGLWQYSFGPNCCVFNCFHLKTHCKWESTGGSILIRGSYCAVCVMTLSKSLIHNCCAV